MQELLLKQEVFGLVETGAKHSTSRKGKRDIKCGPLLFKMTEDESRQVTVNVTGIRYIPYGELTDEEAKAEGYEHISELRDILTRIYGEIKSDEPFTFIEFD